MIKIIKELNIEVTKPNVFQALVAKQYDMNTRFLKVTLTDCGVPVAIPFTNTIKVVINAERKDGQSKGFDGVVNADNTVTVPLHSWMLELEGLVICDISIIETTENDNKKLTTTSFELMVEKAAYGGTDVTNDPQYDVLIELIERVENLELGSADQTYNPESHTAQSGIAVAEAINNKTNKDYVDNAFANAIKGTATGTEICITDVSPIEHNINVSVDNAEAKVFRRGKNLFNAPIVNGDLFGITVQYLPDEDCILINGTSTNTNYKYFKFECNIPVKPNTKYMMKIKRENGETTKPSGGFARCYITNNDSINNSLMYADFSNGEAKGSLASTGEIENIAYVVMLFTNGVNFTDYKVRIQLEEKTITDYEKYVEPTQHTPDADGFLIVPSAYPTTILTTDTDGVTINAEYNRDTNKAFAELTNALISLGGNV